MAERARAQERRVGADVRRLEERGPDLQTRPSRASRSSRGSARRSTAAASTSCAPSGPDYPTLAWRPSTTRSRPPSRWATATGTSATSSPGHAQMRRPQPPTPRTPITRKPDQRPTPTQTPEEPFFRMHSVMPAVLFRMPGKTPILTLSNNAHRHADRIWFLLSTSLKI